MRQPTERKISSRRAELSSRLMAFGPVQKDSLMTEEERKLLLAVARWVLEQEEKDSRRREDTSSLAAEMRAGIEAVRPKSAPDTD
jgi:hypothetical protein